MRKVAERVGVLLSNASAKHVEAVGKYLPIDLMRVLPHRMLRAAYRNSHDRPGWL
jgi:hypothetical protein